MKFSLKQYILFVFTLLLAGLSSVERYFELNQLAFWSIGSGLILMSGITYYLNKKFTPTIIFFVILHFCRYLNEWFTQLIGANFNGTYFLIPVILFTLLILFFSEIKSTIGWWHKDSVDSKLILQMLLAVGISGIGMFIYLKMNTSSIDRFIGMLPEGSFIFLIGMGIAYALLNAVVEEYIFRGMIWNALEKIMTNKSLVILSQAAIFGITHYWGLPGGISGVVLIFTWALYLGYIRQKTGGILGVIGLHFGANLLQYFMLFLFK